MATENTGFTIIPKGRIRSKDKPKSKGELIGQYQEMITAIQSIDGDPLPIHGTIKDDLPATGKKADRIYCVTDGDKGIYLDNGSTVSRVASLSPRQMKASSTAEQTLTVAQMDVVSLSLPVGSWFVNVSFETRVVNANAYITYGLQNVSFGTYLFGSSEDARQTTRNAYFSLHSGFGFVTVASGTNVITLFVGAVSSGLIRQAHMWAVEFLAGD
jgi:hypothetical protein